MIRSMWLRFVIFTLLFTALFSLVRITQPTLAISSVDATSIAGFFSGLTVIFGIISGFIIQVKWTVWDKLVESTNGEISSLRQLLTIVTHLPRRQGEKIKKTAKIYLQNTVYSLGGPVSEHEAGNTISSLRALEESIYALFDDKNVSNIDSIAYEIFRKITDWREKRITFSQEQLHPIIKLFVFGSAATTALLALLMPVHNIWLAGVFTLSVSVFSFAVYVLIDDLDHPYRPGNWHLSARNFEILPREIDS